MEENETKNGLTRRSFLGSTAVGAIGLAAAGFTAGSLINPREANAAQLAIGNTTDFPRLALDVEQVRKYGYYHYFKNGGCGSGSSRALIQGFIDACAAQSPSLVDTGWHKIPLQLYQWGAGGGMGTWGTLCGSLAGSLGVLNLMNLHAILGNEVMEWYTNQNFPLANFDVAGNGLTASATANYGSGALLWPPIPNDNVRGHSVADSPLCHISVSKWVAAAGVKLGDLRPESGNNILFGASVDGVSGTSQGLKEDRCAKVTADTAAYTAQLLNAYFATTSIVPAAWAPQPSMAGCYDCHDNKSKKAPAITKRDSQTMMSCTPCHTEPTSSRK